jgi:phage/plasmid-associated DNA primase
MEEPHMRAFSPHISRGYADQQNSQPVNGEGGNPKPDKGLRSKLRGELPGILNRALRGLKRLNLNEKFTDSESVLKAKQAYIRSNDNVRVFVDECVVVDPIDEIPKPQFYAYYRQWCEQRGERAVTETSLKGALKQAVPALDERRDSGNGKRYWMGIRWANTAWANPES